MGKGVKEENGAPIKKGWATDQTIVGVDGRDGLGSMMTPQQIKTALKIN
jgi:hypothetical protein